VIVNEHDTWQADKSGKANDFKACDVRSPNSWLLGVLRVFVVHKNST
jgi:hypothetical protein